MNKEIKNIDLVILGGGPAGLTAAIYASRAKLNFVLLENGILGGQVRNSYLIENYPGFKEIDGVELADKMQEQAESLGAVIDEFDPVVNIKLQEGNNIIETESYIYNSKTLIIATGAVPKKLPIPNEKKYEGKGIHYCAVCDGAMYENKTIGVVGGGNSALEEATFLTNFAKKVYLIRRYDYFRGEKGLLEEVLNNDKIEILYNTDLIDVDGNDFIEKAILRDEVTKTEKELELNAVFGYIGTEPKSEEFKGYINLNKNGYIITDEKMTTNIKGVYAAGDIREKEYRQITTAVADGTIAALEAEKFIKHN
ncbi:MAG: thioredoxin-disulfide reductase [Clostridiales bacterium]|nr:thioredoxin-disulfide reductase [Clostridiales bacterium]